MNNKGAVSIEAAVAFPLFLFTMLALIFMTEIYTVKGVVYEGVIETAEYMAEYSDKFETPYQAASSGKVTDVIEPAETRGAIAMAFRSILSKRATTLPKKNGNIPL